MADEVVTSGEPHTTVIERRGGGGGIGMLFIGLILLAALVLGGVYLLNQNRNEAIKTDAISSAAKSVEKGADKVGRAAEKAGDAVTGDDKK
ncbi:hypothetical protein [Sphingomonas sp.]|uniref:hypothetical protein n=1 Tax=Sphingomonas sp. TaxID=28214 RepID=UPI001B016335|nr:hypothetical protein [Sphingomonas sp.]MBO9713533.1 hypothetical protein [Sphingomonas sp.]